MGRNVQKCDQIYSAFFDKTRFYVKIASVEIASVEMSGTWLSYRTERITINFGKDVNVVTIFPNGS